MFLCINRLRLADSVADGISLIIVLVSFLAVQQQFSRVLRAFAFHNDVVQVEQLSLRAYSAAVLSQSLRTLQTVLPRHEFHHRFVRFTFHAQYVPFGLSSHTMFIVLGYFLCHGSEESAFWLLTACAEQIAPGMCIDTRWEWEMSARFNYSTIVPSMTYPSLGYYVQSLQGAINDIR